MIESTKMPWYYRVLIYGTGFSVFGAGSAIPMAYRTYRVLSQPISSTDWTPYLDVFGGAVLTVLFGAAAIGLPRIIEQMYCGNSQ